VEQAGVDTFEDFGKLFRAKASMTRNVAVKPLSFASASLG